VREQKLRVEMMQAKKENAHFVQLVEKKKEIEGIEARKVRRGRRKRRDDSTALSLAKAVEGSYGKDRQLTLLRHPFSSGSGLSKTGS